MDSNQEEKQIVYGVVKVNDKGQVIIPADLRKELNIQPGDQLIATIGKDGDSVALFKIKVFNELFLSSKYYEGE